MSANETALGFAWLRSVLAGDATLSGYAPGGVYRQFAPLRTAAPYVIMIYQAGADTTNFGALRGYSSLLYQVKAVGPTRSLTSSMATLVDAAARIDTLITTSTQINVTGGIIKTCVRQQPLEQDELFEGEQWVNLGGLYRIIASAT